LIQIKSKYPLIIIIICLSLVKFITAEEKNFASPSSEDTVLLAQAEETDDTADTVDGVENEELRQFIDTGRKYYRQRQYQSAIDEWKKALALDPENIKIQKYISRAQAKLGITEEKPPTEAVEQAVTPSEQGEAGTVSELIDQGRNFYREGKYEEALAVWENAYKLDPENKRLSRYLIKAKEKVSAGPGEVPAEAPEEGAVPEEEAAEKAEAPAEAKGYDELVTQGKDYFRAGDYENALSVWKQALEENPDDAVLQKYIEKAQSRLQEAQALKEAEPVAEEAPAAGEEVEAPAEPVAPPVIEQIEEEKDIVRRDLPWCVRIAIQNHREARIAEERIKKAEIDLFISRRNFFPNLTFIYSQAQGGSGTDFNTGTGSSTDEESSATRDFVRQRYRFQARHMVYNGGRARSEVNRAKIALDIERRDYNRVISQKALEVAKAYYEVARTEADLKIQYQLLKNAEDSLKLVEEQFKSGLVSELELLNLKALINQIHSQVAAAKQELSHAVLELQHVMNIDITTPIRVYPLEDVEINVDQRYNDIPLIQNVEIFEPTQQSTDTNDQLRQDSYVIYSLKNRADFMVEQLKLEKAQKDLDIAQTEFAPRFEVFGELGQGSEDSVQKTHQLDLSTEWASGVAVSWNFWGNTFELRREERAEAPSVTKVGTEQSREWEVAVGILDNMMPMSEKQELVIKKLEALNDLANQKNTIIEEVRDAYHNFLKAKISKDTAKSKIEFREKSVELYKLQRSLGELDTSKLLQSEIDLALEMSGLHKALSDYFVQLASLDAAIGKNNFYSEEEETKEQTAEQAEAEPSNDGEIAAAPQPESQEVVAFDGMLMKLDDKVTVGPATHKLVDGYKYRKWIALARSKSINLNDYTDKRVRIVGKKVSTEDWIDTVLVDSVFILENE
jgi:outer membrane protein TolC